MALFDGFSVKFALGYSWLRMGLSITEQFKEILVTYIDSIILENCFPNDAESHPYFLECLFLGERDLHGVVRSDLEALQGVP